MFGYDTHVYGMLNKLRRCFWFLGGRCWPGTGLTTPAKDLGLAGNLGEANTMVMSAQTEWLMALQEHPKEQRPGKAFHQPMLVNCRFEFLASRTAEPVGSSLFRGGRVFRLPLIGYLSPWLLWRVNKKPPPIQTTNQGEAEVFPLKSTSGCSSGHIRV